MAGEKILVVDDEKDICVLIQSILAKEDFASMVAYDGAEAMEQLEVYHPDLIILDFMLPDINGPELCLEMRKKTNVPILFLSCKSEEIDKIVSLSSGGDDYITKPFLPGELIARINANLRRTRLVGKDANEEKKLCRLGEYEVDEDMRTVTAPDGSVVRLTNKEYDILLLLAKNPKRIFSAEQIFKIVWKTTVFENDPKTVSVHISGIRKKVETGEQKYIINVKGIGYKFNHELLQG